jgi:hypothetical protein
MKITANIAEDITETAYAAKELAMGRMSGVRFTELGRYIPIAAVSYPEGTETFSSQNILSGLAVHHSF